MVSLSGDNRKRCNGTILSHYDTMYNFFSGFKVKTSWGEKYQKWMAQTEQKIEELQTANNFL